MGGVAVHSADIEWFNSTKTPLFIYLSILCSMSLFISICVFLRLKLCFIAVSSLVYMTHWLLLFDCLSISDWFKKHSIVHWTLSLICTRCHHNIEVSELVHIAPPDAIQECELSRFRYYNIDTLGVSSIWNKQRRQCIQSSINCYVHNLFYQILRRKVVFITV